jgi:RNA polymerase sigma-70 factor (ECF subfamily)
MPSPGSGVRFRHNEITGGRGDVSAEARPKGRVSSTAELESACLVRRMSEGDQSALSDLYDRTNRMVFGLSLRILGNPADAEEVTLDVYTQAWRQAARFDFTRGDPATWLMTLAHSRAIDRLRSRSGAKKREQGLEAVAEFASTGHDPETSSALSERARIVRNAMTCLSPEQREVIELAYFEGLTHVEIAERISQPLGTAKSRIRLGMAKLRDALSPLSEGWSM